jgi:lipopolysaccharide transport system ATP-binding protein
MVAIRIDQLSKLYHIGARRREYQTLRDTIADVAMSPFRRLKRLSRWGDSAAHSAGAAPPDTIWALKDVTFDVQPGEVVGIIGKNGAGKSTLLKILSRITEPTSGRATIHGRVSSLLEVGTGFHPELTGRENVFLNGAILGMTRREIQRKFDTIVDFSEIESFIDTPVKHYSSGMRVRLAFSVAAHLEPEILIVDEVLAVGDAEFQRKCLGKLDSAAQSGRTVLFVSHNMGALAQLCQRGILLEQGRMTADLSIQEAIDLYLARVDKSGLEDLRHRTDRRGSGESRLEGIEAFVGAAGPTLTLYPGKPARFVFHVNPVPTELDLVFTVYDSRGIPVVSLDSRVESDADVRVEGTGTVVCDLDELLFRPGRYRVNVALFRMGETLDHVEGAMSFEVGAGYVGGRSVRPAARSGSLTMPHRWSLPQGA